MKKLLILLTLTITTALQAQAPQGFNYQATVRNSAGDLIVNTNVYFKFNVMQGSQTAVPIFTETHYVPTDDLGQVNLVIGQGTANTGVFSELDWSLGSYYLGIELDTGNGYVAMGTTQLLSVPYALYAENSGNSIPTTPNLQSVLAENNSANNQQIKDLQDPTEAQDAVTKGFLELQIIDLQNQINEIENNTSELPGFISTESLIAYYPFNGNANDISGNGHHGEVNGALPSNDMYGNTNSSFLFTDNQNIVIPDSETLNIYPLTISLWYNPNNYPEGDTNIFSKYVPASWNGFQILYGDNTNVPNNGTTENNGFGTQSWYARNQSNRVIGYYDSPGFLQSNVSINTWYHYVLVIDSTGGKIYINGQLASSDIWDGTPGVSTNNYLWKIGGSYQGNLWYNGKIDDIGVWNRALSQEEVLSLHNGY
jgi:hypothetical protein